MIAAPRSYWYIAATSAEVGRRRPVARTVLGERLVLFRDEHGQPAALRDRCLHRNMRLSGGRVVAGCLECPYHGWRYDAAGRCAHIPAFCHDMPVPEFKTMRVYPTTDRDGYVWVYVGDGPPVGAPRGFPHLREAGWTSFTMETRFPASAFACLENFLDCPHTVFVHRGWFRTRQPRELAARVRRFADRVEAEFLDEAPARSVVSLLFFPRKAALIHTDRFLMPTTSRVDYVFSPRRHFIITSQCTPVAEHETAVYTVISFRFGALGPLVRLLLEPICRRIIGQDVRILRQQTEQIRRFGGPQFTTVETDLFAPHIRALWAAATESKGRAPSLDADIPDIEEKVPIRF